MILKKIIDKLELDNSKINWKQIEWFKFDEENYGSLCLLVLINKDEIPLNKINKNVLIYLLQHPELEDFIISKYNEIKLLVDNIDYYISFNSNINIITHHIYINKYILDNINWENIKYNTDIISIFKKHSKLIKWTEIKNIYNLYRYILNDNELNEYYINTLQEGEKIMEIIEKKIDYKLNIIEDNFNNEILLNKIKLETLQDSFKLKTKQDNNRIDILETNFDNKIDRMDLNYNNYIEMLEENINNKFKSIEKTLKTITTINMVNNSEIRLIKNSFYYKYGYIINILMFILYYNLKN